MEMRRRAQDMTLAAYHTRVLGPQTPNTVPVKWASTMLIHGSGIEYRCQGMSYMIIRSLTPTFLWFNSTSEVYHLPGDLQCSRRLTESSDVSDRRRVYQHWSWVSSRVWHTVMLG